MRARMVSLHGRWRGFSFILLAALAMALVSTLASTFPNPPATSGKCDFGDIERLAVPTPIAIPTPLGIMGGPPSLEYKIERSDRIARASLVSATATVETIRSEGRGVAPTYRGVQLLHFKIHEYLKGGGDDQLLIFVRDGQYDVYTSKESALSAAEWRNTSWDNHQAILFLNAPLLANLAGRHCIPAGDIPTHTESGERLRVARLMRIYDSIAERGFQYSVEHMSRAWLPAQRQLSEAEAAFASQEGTLRFFSARGPSETITIAELKKEIRDDESEESVVPPTTTTTPSERTSTDSSSLESSILDLEPWEGAAVASVAERIYASDVVVRASLVSASDGSLHFRAVEYLKGSGPSEFTVSASTANRNTIWDGREAVLFLGEPPGGGTSDSVRSTNSADFHFADATSWNYSPDPLFSQVYSGDLPQGYTVDSRNPAWLPAKSGSLGPSGSSFIIASTDPAGSFQPVISLADLRATIAWIEGGIVIEGYRECIQASLDIERYHRDWEAYHGRPYERYQEPRQISSGAGAGAVVHDYDLRRSAQYDVPYRTGPDSDLFRAQNIDDDALSSNGYLHRLATSRPLPSATYSVIFHLQPPYAIPCAFQPEYGGLEFLTTATAPNGTIHEAFFDPVALAGGRVGADTSGNGVLRPQALTFNGTGSSLESLSWQSGKVTLTLTDGIDLTGLILDVIDIDGNVSLSLKANDGTVDSTKETYRWSVANAPWAAGDLLMIRLRDASTTVTPVTPTATPGGPTPMPVPPTATPVGPTPTATIKDVPLED